MYTIQSSPSQTEAARLDFPKTSMRQYQVRYSAVTVGTVSDQEIFIDGIANKRLQLPPDCTVTVHAIYSAFAYVTATEAFVAGAGAIATASGTNNAGAVLQVAAPTITSIPAASPTASMTVAFNDTNDCLRIGVTQATAANTAFHEVIVTVSIANKQPVVTGAIN